MDVSPLPLEMPNLLWVVCLIFTGWFLSLLTMYFAGALVQNGPRRPNKQIFFAAFHEKIRRVFKHQRRDTFDTLMVGSNRVLQTNTEPTVFLALVPHDAMSTATRLVMLLAHCILIAYQYPASLKHVNSILTDGNKFSSHNDEWPFFYRVKKHLKDYGIAAVFAFENLHPQVVKTLHLLTPLIFPPFPESVLILVVDAKNRFTHHQKQVWSANNLGKIFLQERLGPYMDSRELAEVINQIGTRCILIHPEKDD